MQRIMVYDDTDTLIQEICERLDFTEPELIDYLLDNLDESARIECGLD